MTRMTATYKTQLNNSNKAHQQAAIGTRIDKMEYGSIATPATGSLTPMTAINYSLAPANASATATHAAVTLAQTVTTTVTTGITQPDYPRVLSVKGNDANVTGNVVINGTDFNDAVISDTIALNAANTVNGAVAFKTVTSIVLPAYAVAGTETVSVGRANIFGLPAACPNAGLVLVKSFDAGAADSGSVTAAITVKGSLFTINGTPNGIKVLELTMLVSAA
jgi:hypothetical protein